MSMLNRASSIIVQDFNKTAKQKSKVFSKSADEFECPDEFDDCDEIDEGNNKALQIKNYTSPTMNTPQ